MVGSTAIFLLVFSFTICSSQKKQDSGPYQVDVYDLKACEDTGKNLVAYNYMTEYVDDDKDRPCFSGTTNVAREFNDDFSSKISVERKLENGTWKEAMKFSFKKACSDMRKYETAWFTILNNLNITANECPIPKGEYSFKCVSLFNQTFSSQKTARYGPYRLTISFWDKDDLIGCSLLEGIARPA